GLEILYGEDVETLGVVGVVERIRQRVGDAKTYLTFDIDCLDPAYAPGTGTPVVGGLTTYEAQRILRSLKIPNLIGGDIVEISPPFDHAGITSLVGVDVMFEMLCIMAEA
ncbi:MAG: arginase family protein, partial [Pseudobdellovibrionaceae bacterium]